MSWLQHCCAICFTYLPGGQLLIKVNQDGKPYRLTVLLNIVQCLTTRLMWVLQFFLKFLFNHNGMRTLCNTIHAHDILEWKSKSCISGYPCNLETSLKSLFFSTDQIFYAIFSDSLLFGRTIQCSPVCLFKVVTFPFLTDWTRKEKERRRKESSRRWGCCQSLAFQCIWKTSIL